MPNKCVGTVHVDGSKVKNILKQANISVRSLGTEGRENYIGWSDKSIYRAIKNGYMSLGLYDALMSKIDISSALMTSDSYLVDRVKVLEIRITQLDERIKWLESVI